jgi:hypothetical protein
MFCHLKLRKHGDESKPNKKIVNSLKRKFKSKMYLTFNRFLDETIHICNRKSSWEVAIYGGIRVGFLWGRIYK